MAWRGPPGLPRRDSFVCPKGADCQWGKDPLEQLTVRFDSWRAVSPGNGACWNLVTKSTNGGRATLQAVTRVKLEQASKAAMWKPTRQKSGEGRADREEPGAGLRHWLITVSTGRTTGVVSTACKEGNPTSVGEARDGCGSRDPANLGGKAEGPSGRRRGSDVPVKPGNSGRGKDPCFWHAWQRGKER